MSEIESVARAYGDLEEENMKRVNELAAAEDEIIKLQTERVKYSQTFTSLNKSKDAHTMVANSLTKQIEKQLNQIKCMNEREKNLTSQLVSIWSYAVVFLILISCVDMLGSRTKHQ